MGRRELARKIGYVPQSTRFLFPKSVFDTVLMGRIPHGTWTPTVKDLETVARVLKELELGDLSQRDLNSLSGGQKQKVMIARAFAQDPDVLLLDEPTSSLDLANQLDIMELIKGLTKKGILAIMAVHDLNLALRYCDSFVLLKAGKVVATGDSDTVSSEVLEEVYDIKAKVLGKGKEKVFLPISRR
jgi:iron complex transport system ATP-binding protein